MKKPVLPPRVVKLIAREVARSQCGDPAYGLKAAKLLHAAVDQCEHEILTRLAPYTVQPDGTYRVLVPRNLRYQHPHLPPRQWTVAAEYDPVTGCWHSDVASGHPSLPRFLGHVWRVKGGDGRMPEYALLSMIGLAYLHSLAEGQT